MAGFLATFRRRFTLRQLGQASLETLIVLPFLMLFIMAIMETVMLYNAKQVLNYAAFCAGRSAGVYGPNAEAEMHRAVALALSGIGTRAPAAEAATLASAFGVSSTIMANVPMPSGIQWDEMRDRFLDAYLRTAIEQTNIVDGGKCIEVHVIYYARCRILPMGKFIGGNEFVRYLTDPGMEHGLIKRYPSLAGDDYVNALLRTKDYTVPMKAVITMDYWVASL
jgi:hypothetical protein